MLFQHFRIREFTSSPIIVFLFNIRDMQSVCKRLRLQCQINNKSKENLFLAIAQLKQYVQKLGPDSTFFLLANKSNLSSKIV